MITHSFIIGLDLEDVAAFSTEHDLNGMPVLVTDAEMMVGIDWANPNYAIFKTPAYIKARNANMTEKFENALLSYKAASFAGIPTFISIFGVMFACMLYDFCRLEDEQYPNMHFKGSMTTIHGREYEFFCADISMVMFAGTHLKKCMYINGETIYNGGFV